MPAPTSVASRQYPLDEELFGRLGGLTREAQEREYALCLRKMNRFAFADVHSDAVEHWNCNDIRAWKKIGDKLTAGTRGY